ncbi:hypothetical protein OAJ38_03480 [Rhodobiaceae bacterium]|nr:hypothetical protein [Rhodobiaceae bacterium]
MNDSMNVDDYGSWLLLIIIITILMYRHIGWWCLPIPVILIVFFDWFSQ